MSLSPNHSYRLRPLSSLDSALAAADDTKLLLLPSKDGPMQLWCVKPGPTNTQGFFTIWNEAIGNGRVLTMKKPDDIGLAEATGDGNAQEWNIVPVEDDEGVYRLGFDQTADGKVMFLGVKDGELVLSDKNGNEEKWEFVALR